MNILKLANHWHKKLGWWALVALIIWAISAITHPIMSWFGPSPISFAPPAMHISTGKLTTATQLFSQPNFLHNVTIAKIVPGSTGAQLQVTYKDQAERKYYDLTDMSLKPNGDEQQAKFLAHHYTGFTENNISSITLIDSFSEQYPWVNRLLPVYKIQYNDLEDSQIFIHTETGAVASMNNDFKRSAQWLFQNLHTLSWLKGSEWGRVIIIALFMLTLIIMAVSGLLLVIKLKSRKMIDKKRRYHRIAAYFLWLPLLGWSASGFYHLLQSNLVTPDGGMREQVLPFSELSENTHWLAEIDNLAINHATLVAGAENTSYLRLSVVPKTVHSGANRNARYAGQASESKAIYINLATGLLSNELNDQTQALALALNYSGLSESDLLNQSLVTHFSPNYDFRNKRLPVWQFEFNDADHRIIYIDSISGILVDQSRTQDRIERWSFSLLHKWNMLTPLIGREIRDVLVVITLSLLLLSAMFGAIMLYRAQSGNKFRVK